MSSDERLCTHIKNRLDDAEIGLQATETSLSQLQARFGRELGTVAASRLEVAVAAVIVEESKNTAIALVALLGGRL